MGRLTRRTNGNGPSGPSLGDWPIAISSSGRYLQNANGTPLFVHGDTPWSIAIQLTNAQIDTYIADRASKGFTAIMFNAIEHYFSSQATFYANVDGNVPFTGMSHSSVDFTVPVESYWTRVDYIVNQAKASGIVCLIQPAYLGFGGGSSSANDQGWDTAVTNATAGNLQSYGAWLANRYTQGNVIWVMGGDYAGAASVTKQWNIATGIRSVTPNALFAGHGARTNEGYAIWNAEASFASFKWVNTTYTDGVEYTYAATAYGRAGPMPFFLMEGYYDGETATAADCRRQAYTTVLSGGCGHLFANNPVWGFGEPHANGGAGAASALSGSLNTTATQHMAHVKALFAAYAWQKLVPKTDTSLVTSALGTGTSRVCPALANDGSFAMIWAPASQSVTVAMSALSPASVRARLYDPTTGTYSAVTGSPFANTGTQSIATGGERVIVLDAA